MQGTGYLVPMNDHIIDYFLQQDLSSDLLMGQQQNM
jgi:hypothetical protein